MFSSEPTPTPLDPTVPAIEVEHLTVSYGSVPALLDVSFAIPSGQLVGIIGPNGSGKSTLMKAILGFLRPDVGTIRIFGTPVERTRKLVAYVPQRGSVDWDFPVTVEDVAMMGRYGNIPWWQWGPSKEDREIVDEALSIVRMADLRKRQIGELSGGQQQRVFMARALAQGAKVVLLDEPFAGVDAATERAILNVLENAKQSGRTLVVVHHDLATAAEFFDAIILLKQRLFAYGTPLQILQPELLSEVYDGNVRAFEHLRNVLREKAK
ncbi:metal ABC transporter ATP-binding protein [Bremerella sp. JC817]|uniref:metal ABC transporter ATP-binding protein n=1 Tax=Bremerella sp. JC817 TaxID=3231756 RepID=UPI003458E3CA